MLRSKHSRQNFLQLKNEEVEVEILYKKQGVVALYKAIAADRYFTSKSMKEGFVTWEETNELDQGQIENLKPVLDSEDERSIRDFIEKQY